MIQIADEHTTAGWSSDVSAALKLRNTEDRFLLCFFKYSCLSASAILKRANKNVT